MVDILSVYWMNGGPSFWRLLGLWIISKQLLITRRRTQRDSRVEVSEVRQNIAFELAPWIRTLQATWGNTIEVWESCINRCCSHCVRLSTHSGTSWGFSAIRNQPTHALQPFALCRYFASVYACICICTVGYLFHYYPLWWYMCASASTYCERELLLSPYKERILSLQLDYLVPCPSQWEHEILVLTVRFKL